MENELRPHFPRRPAVTNNQAPTMPNNHFHVAMPQISGIATSAAPATASATATRSRVATQFPLSPPHGELMWYVADGPIISTRRILPSSIRNASVTRMLLGRLKPG